MGRRAFGRTCVVRAAASPRCNVITSARATTTVVGNGTNGHLVGNSVRHTVGFHGRVGHLEARSSN